MATWWSMVVNIFREYEQVVKNRQEPWSTVPLQSTAWWQTHHSGPLKRRCPGIFPLWPHISPWPRVQRPIIWRRHGDWGVRMAINKVFCCRCHPQLRLLKPHYRLWMDLNIVIDIATCILYVMIRNDSCTCPHTQTEQTNDLNISINIKTHKKIGIHIN